MKYTIFQLKKNKLDAKNSVCLCNKKYKSRWSQILYGLQTLKHQLAAVFFFSFFLGQHQQKKTFLQAGVLKSAAHIVCLI
jgi:hypothetical protein